ncbi:acyltransferase family protein [soil metagenome]
MVKSGNRNSALDVIRIFAAICVVYIHVTDPFLSYSPYFGIQGTAWWILNILNVIFRTSVPLFVMISGLLLLNTEKKLDSNSFYKRRFAKIGIPTVIWLVIYFVILAFTGPALSLPSLIERLLTANIFHLYFLVLILELYFVTPLFYDFLKNNSAKAQRVLLAATFTLTTVVALTGRLFPGSKVSLTSNITTVFIPFLFYYLLGPALKKVKLSLSSIICLIIIFFYFVIFIAIVSRGDVGAYSRSFEGLPIMALSIAVCLVLSQLNRLKVFTNERFQSVLSFISNSMFGMYLIHVLVLLLVDHFYPVLPGHVGSPMWFVVLIKGGVVVIISFTLSVILRKLPFIRYISP